MANDYTCYPDLLAEVHIPENGILSRTLHQDDRVKVLVFGFAAGQELSAHTASMPAILHFLEGEARLTLGNETKEVAAGAWVHMPPQLEHGIFAKTPVILLLTMLKQPK